MARAGHGGARLRRCVGGTRVPRFPPALLPFGALQFPFGVELPRHERSRLRGALGAACRFKARGIMAARPRMARVPLESPRHAQQGIARRRLSRAARCAVFGRCPYALGQYGRARCAWHHRRKRTSCGRQLRPRRRRQAHGHHPRSRRHGTDAAHHGVVFR